MATPNYSYEKRQRELAKKRKTEEKRQRKVHRGDDQPSNDNNNLRPGEPGPAPVDNQASETGVSARNG